MREKPATGSQRKINEWLSSHLANSVVTLSGIQISLLGFGWGWPRLKNLGENGLAKNDLK